MKTNQKELLSKLLEKRKDSVHIQHPYDILIHAVLNTISYDELTLDFVGNNYIEFKDSILSN